ncbi:MAG: hypothetical protein DMG16_27220 [Acidobacteria bacterium]|nr:MAG: hypothetical protein DMG16_27220 [Acidobacteriota bacterium]
MATTDVVEFKLALALDAYGIELRLWKEPGEREWGATLRDDSNIVDCHFEEDNLTLAKLHVLGDARNRVMSRSRSSELPGCNTFLDSWKPVKMAKRGHSISR